MSGTPDQRCPRGISSLAPDHSGLDRLNAAVSSPNTTNAPLLVSFGVSVSALGHLVSTSLASAGLDQLRAG